MASFSRAFLRIKALPRIQLTIKSMAENRASLVSGGNTYSKNEQQKTIKREIKLGGVLEKGWKTIECLITGQEYFIDQATFTAPSYSSSSFGAA